MNIVTIIRLIASILLGGILVWGGIKKFERPFSSPTSMIEKVEKEGAASLTENMATLKIRNYIFGMKQTGYFWPLLGIVEIVGGLLLLSQGATLLGAVIVLPTVLHIFLFHLFLEPHEVGELIQTVLMLLANLFLIGIAYPKWQHLIWDMPSFSSKKA